MGSNTTIDVVGALCAYVEKEPPRYDKKQRALFAADGTKFEGIPYANAEDLPGHGDAITARVGPTG